jgi:transcription elongation factor Elf1
MTTAGIVGCSPYGMACTECNELVIAPEWSGYVGKHEVRHFWSCENCGHEIEMLVNPHGQSAYAASIRFGT